MTRIFNPIRLLTITFVLITSFAVLSLVTACDTQSANSVARVVNVIVTGIYRYDGGVCPGQGKFVTANSGGEVTSLNVRQAGDQLEAVSNNDLIFRGTIGVAVDGVATFTLEGNTTVGNNVIISGTIAVGSGVGVMNATWIEDTLFSSVCGSATGPMVITIPDLGVSPSSATLADTESQEFTATGGTSPYSWTLSNTGLGALDTDTGSTVTYTVTSITNGTQTITVTDTATNVVTATVTQETP